MGTQWGDGREPDPDPHTGRPREAVPVPLPPDDQPPATREGVDLVAVAAVVVGLLGIVVCGIVAALVGAVLASVAGQRARETGRSLETAYLAFGLAGIDGVVWLVLHLLFDIPIQIG